jgi:hypothetical protein
MFLLCPNRCDKNNPIYHSPALSSELLKRDVFAIRDHFDGFMRSHPFPMLSVAYSAFHSPESMRILSVFVQTIFSAVAHGWREADETHKAFEAIYEQKKGVAKLPRGEARLAALNPTERSTLLAALGGQVVIHFSMPGLPVSNELAGVLCCSQPQSHTESTPRFHRRELWYLRLS